MDVYGFVVNLNTSESTIAEDSNFFSYYLLACSIADLESEPGLFISNKEVMRLMPFFLSSSL